MKLDRIARMMGAALLVLAGCDPAPSTPDAAGEEDAGEHAMPDGGSAIGDAGRDAGATRADAGELAPIVTWGPCDNWLTEPTPQSSCADVTVPLRWEEPDGPTITVSVRRFPNIDGGGRGQLWMLQGGPGGSTTELEHALSSVFDAAPGLDVYMLEHRGVGASSRLGCPDQESASSPGGTIVTGDEMRACLESAIAARGDELTAFGPEQAAQDLGALIEATREPGQEVFVYGVSYGTWWLHHYLHHYPDQASGVVLDSICSPGTCALPLLFSENHDRVTRTFLAACGADPLCSSKVTSDPAAMLADVIARLDDGHCAEVVAAGLDSGKLRDIVGAFMRASSLRGMIPSIFYRLDRCDAGDVTALTRLASNLLQPLLEPPAVTTPFAASQVLQAVVTRSELWDERAVTIEALDLAEQGFVARARIPGAEAYDVLPRYPRPPEADVFPETSIPMLLVNGTMDPQTPTWSADPAGAHYAGAYQHYVLFDRAAHAIMFSYGSFSSEQSCQDRILRDFLSDPRGPLDTSCIADLPAYDFAPAFLASVFYGTSDVYENVTTTSTARLDPERVRALRAQARALVSDPTAFGAF